MVSDDASDPVLQKATATTIQWASGKNPGVKVSCLPDLVTQLCSFVSSSTGQKIPNANLNIKVHMLTYVRVHRMEIINTEVRPWKMSDFSESDRFFAPWC